MAKADPNKLKKVQEIGRRDILFSVARVPESSRLFVGSSDFHVYEVDLAAEKPEPQQRGGHESYVMGVALSGEQVISGGWDGRLNWWNTADGKQVRSNEAHDRWIRNLAISPDGKIVASVADDMVCRLWDAASAKKLKELQGHDAKTPHNYPSMLYACAFSPDGKHLATGDRVGRIVVWEVASGKQVKTLEAPVMYTWDPRARRHSIGGIRSLAFSPDGKLLAAGGMGKVGNIDHLGGKSRLEVFDWQQGEKLWETESDKFKGLIEHLAFHPQGDWLLAAGGDHKGMTIFFDVANKSVIREDQAPMHVHSFALNETGDAFYAVGHQKIAVWELKG